MIYDAIIVGGSFAGLTAALQLARARRRVLVIDAGQPRNRFSAHAHGILARDGYAGSDLLAAARAQLLAYPTASIRDGKAVSAEPGGGLFTVVGEDGHASVGKRLILATGVSDRLPALPGLAERWGKTVLHCPYCHGYEIGGGSIGVLASGPLSLMQASIVADWGDVTLFSDAPLELDEAAQLLVRRRRIKLEAVPVVAIEGAAPAIEALRLADGRAVPLRALFIGAPIAQTSALAAQLGCAFDDTPLGPIVRTDAWKLTSVPGVYAAGDAARFPHSVTLASADGATAGIGAHHALISEEIGVA